jgi:hypothetical protein
MQPPRHALGALLLESSHAQRAAVVFAEDLGIGIIDGDGVSRSLPRSTQNRRNIWALAGLAACFK